jgi:nucleoside-diphosphate-sugar epimerase
VLRKVDVTLAKIFDLAGKRIYVTGHRGMVGSAIVRRLATCSCDVITASRDEVGGQGRRHSCQQRLSC